MGSGDRSGTKHRTSPPIVGLLRSSSSQVVSIRSDSGRSRPVHETQPLLGQESFLLLRLFFLSTSFRLRLPFLERFRDSSPKRGFQFSFVVTPNVPDQVDNQKGNDLVNFSQGGVDQR